MVRDHNYVYSASECSKGENFTCSESDRKWTCIYIYIHTHIYIYKIYIHTYIIIIYVYDM
jgi:hypothetical protein